MNREFLLNIFFLVGINLLIKPFYLFAIDRNVQNVVGTEAYGTYFTLLNLTLILNIFNDFGMRNFTSRYFSQNNHLLKKYFTSLLSLKLSLSVLYALLILLVGWGLGYLPMFSGLLLVIAGSRIAISFIEFFRSNLAGLAHYRADSLVSVLHRFILIVIAGILIWTPSFRAQFTIQWFVWAELIAIGSTVVVTFFLIPKSFRKLNFQFDLKFLLVFLRQSYPYALIVLLMMLYNRVDAIMIEQLLPNGKEEAGIYAAGYRLLDAASMFSLLFANLLLPMFARMLKEQESIETLVSISFRLLMVAAITSSVAIYFYRQEIVQLLYVEATPYWGNILAMLMWSFIAISGTHVFGTALLAKGTIRWLNQLFLLGIVVNIVLNLFFIPQYQALGAATTTVVTQFFVIIGEIILVARVLKVGKLAWLLQTIAFALSFFAATYFVTEWIEAQWLIKFLICLFLGVLLAIVLKLLDVKAVLRLLVSASA